MRTRWRKLGLMFSPAGDREWMQTHASAPVVVRRDRYVYRAFFSTRDCSNRSHVGYCDFDIRRPKRPLAVAQEPALAPGPLGFFDDHGTYASSVVEHDGRLLMYYIGWNRGPRPALFYSSIGLAVSSDGGDTFVKTSKAPILARSEFDPCLVTAPYVIRDGELWRMWYVSGFRWEGEGEKLRSYYDIKYAESRDGVHWHREGITCIELAQNETNISRPCVRKEGSVYKMWYSRNAGDGYRVGYAESPNGLSWRRMDDAIDLDLSASGWDSRAIAYPLVWDHEGTRYMLYNGNEFGREGFGLAVEAS